jgi:hypothetical protein
VVPCVAGDNRCCVSRISAFQWEVAKKRPQLGPAEAAKAALPGAPAPSASPTAGRGDEAMTINPFDLTAIAGFMAVGMWLETVGDKHGFVDEFFAPIPLAATGCIYAVLRSLIY